MCGSIFKFEEQASVFSHDGGPDYRDLPQASPPGLGRRAARPGFLASCPG